MSVGTAFHPGPRPSTASSSGGSGRATTPRPCTPTPTTSSTTRSARRPRVIDVSPLYKYRRPGRTRSGSSTGSSPATRRSSTVGQVFYTPWCDEHGKVIDDGTVHRLDERELPLDRRRPPVPLAHARTPPASTSRSRTSPRRSAALALQGPFSRAVLEAATGESFADLRYFRRRADHVAGVGDRRLAHRLHRRPGLRAVDPRRVRAATSGTRCSRPAGRTRSGPPGMLALDVARLEAGLILLEVDYTSARHAMNPEQNYSPSEIGLGGSWRSTRPTTSAGARSQREAGRGRPGPPARRPELDWYDIEGLFGAQGLPPAISPVVDRSPRARLRRTAARSAGRRRTAGARSSSRRSRSRPCRRATSARAAARRWSGPSRAAVAASPRRVVELPFLDLERKRA